MRFVGLEADLATKTSVNDFRMALKGLVKYDIGIVCLNAGDFVTGPFDLVSDWEVERVIGLNVLHPVYLTKAILPTLQAR